MPPTPPDDDERPGIGGELIIPAASIAFCIYYASTILDSPWTAQATAAVVGVVLVVCCLLLFARTGVLLVRRQARLGFAALLEPYHARGRKAGMLALTLAALVAMPWLGFTLTSILFLALCIMLLREGRDWSFVIGFAVTLSVVWFVVFVLIFERRLPLGWLDRRLQSFFKPLLALIGID